MVKFTVTQVGLADRKLKQLLRLLSCDVGRRRVSVQVSRVFFTTMSTTFRVGDRVRGVAWFDLLAGVPGTVVELVEVQRHWSWHVGERLEQDLVVQFDRPVLVLGQPRSSHQDLAGCFEYEYAPLIDIKRRLTYKQKAPPVYHQCICSRRARACALQRYTCTCAEEPDVDVKRRRLTYKQPAPPAYQLTENQHHVADTSDAEPSVADSYDSENASEDEEHVEFMQPQPFVPFSGTPRRLV